MIDHKPELEKIIKLLHRISQKINLIENTSVVSQAAASGTSDVITKNGTKYTEIITGGGKKTTHTWNEHTLQSMILHVSQTGSPNMNIPPYYDQKAALQITECAKKWWWKRASAELKFKYSYNGTFLQAGDSHQNLTNAKGEGLIDGATFISMIVLGIEVENSPYWTYRGQANKTYSKSQLTPSTSTYKWADLQLFNHPIVNQMTFSQEDSTYSGNWTSAQLGAYYWAAGRCFTNYADARDGDLVFFYNPNEYAFKGIRDVAIITDNKTRYYISANDGNGISRINISERNDAIFYARPFYEPIKTGASTDFDSTVNRLPLPLMNTTTNASGVTFSCSNYTITRTNTAAPSAAITPTIFNTTTPTFTVGNLGIFLEPGTYSFSTGAKPGGNWGTTYNYYIERLFFSGSNISGIRTYNDGSTGNAARDGYPQQLEFRGYGGTFTVSAPGVAIYQFQCYMSKTNFAANAPTSWTPIIKRIA